MTLTTVPDDATLARLHDEHVRQLERTYGEVLQKHGLDAVVLHAGTAKLRSPFDDNYWPLRVTPHFQHWVPLAQPDAVIVVENGRRARLVWPREVSFWESPPLPERDHWRAALDIVEAANAKSVKEHLPQGHVAFVGDGHAAFEWGFGAEQTNPPALVAALDALRTRKTQYEVACIAEANRRASLGHLRVAEAFKGGEHAELDLHLLYLGATAQDDPETPYKNIVALGRSAATLHHVDYRRKPGPPSDTLLLDAGATFLGYASDITRTYVKPRSEAATTFAQLLAGMEKLQQQLCANVHAGLPYEDLHEQSHRLIGALLREVGLVRLSVEEMTEASDVTRTFYPHGLGHSLGLQTHDVGCAQVKPKPRNPFLRNTSVITPGQVFTIEPGIYFIPGLLDKLRAAPQAAAVDWRMVGALSDLGGIRIEDDVLVREGAPVENLTRAVLA